MPCDEVQFPGQLVGHFTGGEPIRAILPKVLGQKISDSSSDCCEEGNVAGTVYGLQLTFDVPQGKHNGTLCVRVCWYDIVYRSLVQFDKKEQTY